jgi:hypothetical protein
MPTKKAMYTPFLMFSTSLPSSIKFNPEVQNREDIDFLTRAQQQGARVHQQINALYSVHDDKSRPWSRGNLSSFFLWTRYLIRFDLKSAFCYFFGIGMQTLVLKYLNKLKNSMVLIGKFRNLDS